MNISTRDYVVALAGFLGEHGTTMSIEDWAYVPSSATKDATSACVLMPLFVAEGL